MDAEGRLADSQLFTVRVWNEDLGGGRSEVRGQVRHVLSGATRHFRRWTDLEAFVATTVAGDRQIHGNRGSSARKGER